MPPSMLFFYILLLFLLNTATAVSTERKSYQEELLQSKTKIHSLDKSIALDKQKRSKLKTRLKKRTQIIRKLNNKISTLENQISNGAEHLRKLEANLVVEGRNTQERKQNLAKQMRIAYQMGIRSDVELLLNQNSPGTFERVKVYSEYFSRSGQEEITSALFSMRKLAESRLRAAKIRRTHLANQRNLATTKKSEVLEVQARKQLLFQLNRQIGSKNSRIEQLNDDVSKLQNLVLELDRKEEQRKKSKLAGRGDLPWPVKGEILARYGQAKFGGKLKWNGLFLASSENSEVRAIAAGEIVYADWLNGFGLLLIVNHGEGVMSLYGNNRDLHSDIGESVKKGQLIATVGNSSGQTETGLYFEIRENAVAVDPQEWIAPKMRFVKTSYLQMQ